MDDDLHAPRAGSDQLCRQSGAWPDSSAHHQGVALELRAIRAGEREFLFVVCSLVHCDDVVVRSHREVQRFTVVDKSDFSPSPLRVHSDTLSSKEALPVSSFKRRGSLWPSRCTCICSWSFSSSVWLCFCFFVGSRFDLPPPVGGPSAAQGNSPKEGAWAPSTSGSMRTPTREKGNGRKKCDAPQ